MSQVLQNVRYEDECYTIIFINVTSHTGELFSFLNKQTDRLDFHWNKWGEWRDILRPYSVHAFLIRAWSSKSESGMNFAPAMHLCTFLNIEEARIFNSAYLLHYNKLLEECNVERLNELATKFSEALLDMQEFRSHWTDLCEQAAGSIMNTELFDVFGFKHPDIRQLNRPWESEIVIDECDHWDFRVDDE